DVVAIAAVRATREAIVARGRERLPSIIGIPIAGETAGKETFDGATEAAMFPGDLPDDPQPLFVGVTEPFKGLADAQAGEADYRFLRFRPPAVDNKTHPALPHIRLDRALEFLLGDYLA